MSASLPALLLLLLSHFSRVQLCVTPWAVACQAPLSTGFSRQEYQNGLPWPPPGIFPTQGSNPGLLHSLPLSHQESTCSSMSPYIYPSAHPPSFAPPTHPSIHQPLIKHLLCWMLMFRDECYLASDIKWLTLVRVNREMNQWGNPIVSVLGQNEPLVLWLHGDKVSKSSLGRTR